jgi:hypothetical protein
MHSFNIKNKFDQLKYIREHYVITEKDFYPPEDTRLYESGIDDIDNGDNFEDYAKWFYSNYEYEIFDI